MGRRSFLAVITKNKCNPEIEWLGHASASGAKGDTALHGKGGLG